MIDSPVSQLAMCCQCSRQWQHENGGDGASKRRRCGLEFVVHLIRPDSCAAGWAIADGRLDDELDPVKGTDAWSEEEDGRTSVEFDYGKLVEKR